MEMKLELVPIPVSDVDRAKAFYVDKIGFHLDHDVLPDGKIRIVQLTPPGSACSMLLSSGIDEYASVPPGSVKGLHLVVRDARKARETLLSRGVAVSEIQEFDQGIKHVGFSDPDGNSWVLQELPWRAAEFKD
ncbi:MAG: VOC family protein [Anaerolineae bacterium]